MSDSTRAEVAGGLTTFLTMAYIVVLNPAILSDGTGMPFDGVLTATVLVAFVGTLAMGLFAKLPYAVAPGMGLNAFFAYSLVVGRGVPWATALGLVFWSGVLFLLASVTPLRVIVARAIPAHLRVAAAAGIGLLLAFLGLKAMGLVVDHPATLVGPGRVGATTLYALAGLVVMLVLQRRRSPWAFLAGIAVATAIGLATGEVRPPDAWVRAPSLDGVPFAFDPIAALDVALLPALITLLFTDLFDSLSTFLGVSRAAGLVDEEGQPLRLKEGLTVDAVATLVSGLAGSSPGTTYVESTAGIEAGARTGLASIVTACCFLPCLFLSPVAAMIPAWATAPVLLLVGLAMFRPLGTVAWGKAEKALPAFLTVILMPLTVSITQGILWGFVSHAVLYALAGRGREVGPVMGGLALVSVGLLLVESLAG